MQLKSFDAEYEVTRYKNGIKVKKPLSNSAETLRIKHLLDQPVNSYIVNADSNLRVINEAGQQFCGFASKEDAVDRSIRDIADKQTANLVITNHHKVFHSKNSLFAEEEIFLKDGSVFQALTNIYPVYDERETVCGVFGCSIIIGIDDIASAYAIMAKLGLIDHLAQNVQIIPKDQNIYLSYREKQCLNLMCNGKSAKEIGLTLNLSYRTVEHYIDNIKNKYGVNNKVDLIIKVFDALN